MVGQDIVQAKAIAAWHVAQFGHGLQICFLEGALLHQSTNANFIWRGIRHFNFYLGSRRVADFAVQGVNLPIGGHRVACPFVAAAYHHFIETLQPSQSVTAFEVNKGGINHFFDRRIPAHSRSKAFDF